MTKWQLGNPTSVRRNGSDTSVAASVAHTARWQRPDAHRVSQAAHYPSTSEMFELVRSLASGFCKSVRGITSAIPVLASTRWLHFLREGGSNITFHGLAIPHDPNHEPLRRRLQRRCHGCSRCWLQQNQKLCPSRADPQPGQAQRHCFQSKQWRAKSRRN